MIARGFDPYDARHREVHDSPLERSWEASKRQFWNDTEVLDALIAEHGPPRLSADQRESLAAILAIIYHGEIVALHVSADLLTRVDDLEAQKVLAAQVIEEAKHLTAFQRYLREAGLTPPPIDPWARRVLEAVRREKDPTLKLIGMQLTVENAAHSIFRNLCDAVDEPVLRGLLERVDRDEVKHVGLARNYLPRLLPRVRRRDLPRFWARQAWWALCLLVATVRNRRHAERLGIDVNLTTKAQLRELNRAIRSVGRREERRAILGLPDRINDWLVDRIVPRRSRA